MKKALVTFGDNYFEGTRERFRKEAVASVCFDEVYGWGPKDLDPDFATKHARFIKDHPRGYGFWIWKPRVVRQAFAKVNDGDIVVYADAGCAMNPRGAGRLNDYFERVRSHPSGLLAFELRGLLERQYTKADVFAAMSAESFRDRPMHMATIIVLRKCAASGKFLEEWERWCGDYALISDAPGRIPNAPDFKSHRHDQSIYSLLCKLRAVDSILDESYGDGAIGPILAARIRPRLSFATKLKRSFLKRRGEWFGLRR